MPGIQILLREKLFPEERSAWTLHRSEQGRYLLRKKPVLQERKRVSRLTRIKTGIRQSKHWPAGSGFIDALFPLLYKKRILFCCFA